MDPPDKKRFSCSACKYETGIRRYIHRHLSTCKVVSNPKPYMIETPTITCHYCNISVKTYTSKNYMEEHLKKCSIKNSIKDSTTTIINNNSNNTSVQNTYNTYINITINPYYSPTSRHLIYDENLARNRIEMFKQVFFNEKMPQNHSLVYDEKTHMVKVYSDNTNYTSVELKNLMMKVSSPLDKIQEKLLKDNVIDKNEFDRINKLIDATYGEDEAKNRYRYGEIAREYQDIPKRTRYIMDQEKEKELIALDKSKETPIITEEEEEEEEEE